MNSVNNTMDKHSNMVINTKFIDSQSPGEFADAHKRDRFERVSEVDRSCRQAMISEGRTFAETVNEIEHFLPAGETIKARLHIVMSTEDAKFDADEVWLQQTSGCLCCKKR